MSVAVEFEAIDDADSIEHKMIVDFVSIDIEYPGVDEDICSKLDCPLVHGQRYTYTFDVEVKEYLPLMTTLVTWQAGASPHVFCAATNVTFEASDTNETPNPIH